MKFLNTDKHEKLIKMLKQSQQGFRFEQDKIKLSILTHLDSQHLNLGQKTRFTEISKPRNVFAHRLAYAVASLLLFVGLGSTLAYANSAKPGDKLFVLDKIQEQVILKIPLPQETKANIRANIVAERALELDKLSERVNHEEIKAKAVETSQQSLTNAIEKVSENRDKLKERGKEKAALKMEAVLNRLEVLAQEQETKADRIHRNLKDQKLRSEVGLKLEEIKKARLKARVGKTIDPGSDNKDQDEDRTAD